MRAALLVVLVAFSGCIGNVYEGPDLAALDAQLTVHFEEGRCPVAMPVAEDASLAAASSEAIARTHGVHKRAFMPGQVDAILNESRYVHVAFPGNATIELPAYDAVEERSFANLYLVWETSAGVDNVLSDGGEYGSTYAMEELADRARAAAQASCGWGAGPASG